jgi:hypothetical protein
VAVSNVGAMTPGTTINLTGQLALSAPQHAKMAIKPASGVGKKPTIWLAYATDYGTTEGRDCSLPANWFTKDMTWWLSKSTDNGVTWTHLQIDHDPAWPNCLSATQMGGNRAIPSIEYDASTGRVVLAYSRHVDDAGGSFVGTRIKIKQTPTATGNANAFDTWSPVCNPAVCPQPPPMGMSCFINGAPPVGETFCHEFGADVGIKTSGTRKVAVVWHETKDSQLNPLFPHPPVGDNVNVNPLLSDIWGASLRSGSPYDNAPPTVNRITPLAGNVPWEDKGRNGNLWWGDYENGVVGLTNKFYTIWGDNRDGSTTTRLYGAEFNE